MAKTKIERAVADWQARQAESGSGQDAAGLRSKRSFETPSGIPLPDLFTPTARSLSESYQLEQIGFPGQFPYTRGIHSTMYRSRHWTMRQYAGFGSAAETNARYRYLLAQGTTGLSVAFDLPTQMGRDSDDPASQGEVGRVGVAVDSIADMRVLFDQIPLDRISTSMTINATAHILLALYLAVAKERGIGWDKLRGTIQNDVLKEYIARGTYIYPPQPALKIVTDVFEFCRDQVPSWNTISISGYHIREAGSTAVQELAFTLGNAIAYIDAAVSRGLDIDSIAPRVAFFFNCHNNFLEEIAKFRAARRLWAGIMRERFGAKNPSSWLLRFHTQTAGSSLTAQQPEVNIVRTALQALAAVFGGTQSLHTNGYDEALGLPTEEAALLALRTQQVIAAESGVADVIDPFGGSYAVESLTDEVEVRTRGILEQIDLLGGMPKAIELGYPQAEIEDSAFRYQQRVERGEVEIVGVNLFAQQKDEPRVPTSFSVDPAAEREQIARLSAFRSKRDAVAYERSIVSLRAVVTAGGNIMPAVIAAVESGATVGEISELLRIQYGVYRGS